MRKTHFRVAASLLDEIVSVEKNLVSQYPVCPRIVAQFALFILLSLPMCKPLQTQLVGCMPLSLHIWRILVQMKKGQELGFNVHVKHLVSRSRCIVGSKQSRVVVRFVSKAVQRVDSSVCPAQRGCRDHVQRARASSQSGQAQRESEQSTNHNGTGEPFGTRC